MKTALFHWDAKQADRLAPALGDDIKVFVVGACTAARFDTILVVSPPEHRLKTQDARDGYSRWLVEMLPTLLSPGREQRIYFL
ncbi:hypothetical protein PAPPERLAPAPP_00480 [Brevundimonas phage vB_BpoS-Papperlapapp]|uniref:Uncharacterized protein n=1 Tax=Brevundimonas phage vB_BpoS-Domovoi TaxID=2948598 RepID=A0A9E7MRV6_9CAUD|nr:hypothetical protein DOMOVOI_05250 [Brevundimonas phage vB_BpoS-Domovoi]USN15790.1 hypothetical protein PAPPERLAPAPP_00480 [Brevundimonas phage vB_BpoS-Papperlapapp]